MHNELSDFDPALWDAINHELIRQEEQIELIASENYVSHHVLQVQGSVLTNKYAEGYPGKRYYGGCEYVDVAEQLAIDRAKKLFNADYANVQPHSGASANAAVMMALLQPGDTILGMSLTDGGHLTHGSPVNFSGKLYHVVSYGVHPETKRIDYDEILALAKQHRPKLIIGGFSAYSRRIDWKRFRDIADEVDAFLLVDMAHVAGLVAVGLYPSPLPYADVVTTTTHKTLRGPRGGMILARQQEWIERKMNAGVFPGLQGGPLMHVIAAKAVAFQEALQPTFKDYQAQVLKNASALADALQTQGFDIVSGGTDNHLMLVDLRRQKLTGKMAEAVLHQALITTNKNTIPQDPESPFITSGLRLGSPAVTTRGFKEHDLQQVAAWIVEILTHVGEEACINRVKQEVLETCQQFPVYQK